MFDKNPKSKYCAHVCMYNNEYSTILYFNHYSIDPHNGILTIFSEKDTHFVDLQVSPNAWKWVGPNPDYEGE